jgi:mono/diheme cytochrome c family protein
MSAESSRTAVGPAGDLVVAVSFALARARYFARRLPGSPIVCGLMFGVGVFVQSQVVFAPLTGSGVFSHSDLQLQIGGLLGPLEFGTRPYDIVRHTSTRLRQLSDGATAASGARCLCVIDQPITQQLLREGSYMVLLTLLPRVALAATLAAGPGSHHPVAAQPGTAVHETAVLVTTHVTSVATPTVPGTPDITSAMVDAGRNVFHGAGGCFACHGTSMQGSAVAPPLDKKGGKPWLAAKDGTYEAILNVITHGVAGTIMVSHPNGISDGMAAEVAAYVWAVNHQGVKP